MTHVRLTSNNGDKESENQNVSSSQGRALRKRRRLRCSSPSSLKISSAALETQSEQFKFSDDINCKLEKEMPNYQKVSFTHNQVQDIKKSCSVEKKKKSVRKGSYGFRRWSVILCTIDKESNGRNKVKEQAKKKIVTDNGNRKPVKNRELTVVRATPCARNRMPCDRRKMRKIRLFDPSKDRSRGQRGNEAMLQRAKRKVIKELNRQEKLGLNKPSPLEQAFFDATNENFLSFDYQRMKSLVRHARFCNSSELKDFQADDDAYNDNVNIVLNCNKPFVESDICITLFHECLHNTVERSGKPGNPQLSAHIEHIAMALLGDREEQQEYFEKYFNLDYVNESWLKVHQRKKRRRNPRYLTNVYDYESD